MADLSNLHLHPAPALYFLGRTDMGVYKPRLQPHLSWWNLYHVYAYSLYCIIHHVNKVLFYSIVTWMLLFTLISFTPSGRHFATDWYSFSIISIHLWILKVLNFKLHGIDFCGSLKSVNNCSSGKTLSSIVFQGFVLGIFYKALRPFLPCLKALKILYVIWTPFKNKSLDSLENWYGHIMAGTSVS